MQVPHFIKIACKKIYKDEEKSIIAYCKLVEKYGDNGEKIYRKSKGNVKADTYHVNVEIENKYRKIETIKEFRVDLYDNCHEIPVLIIFCN